MNILNTSSNHIFFTRALNLIYSTLSNDKSVNEFIVWDLGLSNWQVKYLERIPNVSVQIPPKDNPNWDKCFSWKAHVFNAASSGLFLHLDAGNEVQSDISHIFKTIKEEGFFFIDQGHFLVDIIDDELLRMYPNLLDKLDSCLVISAGNIGINTSNLKGSTLVRDFELLVLLGLNMGYSTSEEQKYSDVSNFIRNCRLFRHDQSVLNALIYSSSTPRYHPHNIYASTTLDNCIIYNNRARRYKYIYHNRGYVQVSMLYLYDLIFAVKGKVVKWKKLLMPTQ